MLPTGDSLTQKLRMRRRAVPRALGKGLDAAAKVILKGAREQWPGLDRAAIHIYATGASKKRWRSRRDGPTVRRVENLASYARYTNQGYTFRGKGTAKPWRARGASRYTRLTQQVYGAAAGKAFRTAVSAVLRGSDG